MTLPILGIDPGGSNGGAVLLSDDGATVLAAWSWKRVQRESRDAWVMCFVREGLPGFEHTVASMNEVGERIALGAYIQAGKAWRLVVEGLFGRAFTLERLSWYSGLVAGPCLAGTVGDVFRPKASTWRPAVLGVAPREDSDVCEAKAIAFVQQSLNGMGALATNPHVAEAACMAVYAHRMQPWNAKGELAPRKRPKRTSGKRKRRAA